MVKIRYQIATYSLSLLLDKIGSDYYIQSMTVTAQLFREIETMPEEEAAQVLDFAMFIKGRHNTTKPNNGIAIKDAYGVFKELKGMDTTIERDEQDRI